MLTPAPCDVNNLRDSFLLLFNQVMMFLFSLSWNDSFLNRSHLKQKWKAVSWWRVWQMLAVNWRVPHVFGSLFFLSKPCRSAAAVSGALQLYCAAGRWYSEGLFRGAVSVDSVMNSTWVQSCWMSCKMRPKWELRIW